LINNFNIITTEIDNNQPKKKKGYHFDLDAWPYTFLEYLRGGIEINVMVAIDFT